jgi:hypothetical protein
MGWCTSHSRLRQLVALLIGLGASGIVSAKNYAPAAFQLVRVPGNKQEAAAVRSGGTNQSSVGALTPEQKPGAGLLDIITASGVALTVDSKFSLSLIARNGTVSVRQVVSTLNDEATEKWVSAFNQLTEEKPVAAETLTTLPLTLSSDVTPNVVSGKGSLVLWYQTAGSATVVPTKPWEFVIIKSAPDVSISLAVIRSQ